MELILSGDSLNVGRIAINNWYSGQTNIFSAGTGANSIKSIAGNGLAASSFSFSIGKGNNATSPYATILGGSGSTASNTFAVILNGKGQTASAAYSLIGNGNFHTANSTRSMVLQGKQNTASGTYSSVINGFNSTAGGSFSTCINGQSNSASAQFSIVGGFACTASGVKSIALGATCTASAAYSSSIGRNNAVSGAYSLAWGANHTITHQNAVALGNGATSTAANQIIMANGGGNTFRIDLSDGKIHSTSGLITSPADYAELFEWADKNINNEIRYGYGVSLADNGTIVIGGENIIGIVSATPAIIGDAASLSWKNKYVVDEWGKRKQTTIKSFFSNELEKIVYIDSENNYYSRQPVNEKIKNDYKITESINIPDEVSTFEMFEINPDYDESKPYVSRIDRISFSAVGLLGKLKLRTAEKITGSLIDINTDGMAMNGKKYTIISIDKDYDGEYGIVTILFK